ncbi:hypothetical protein CLOM_g10357 [Closterium sp. NIES-68]|nr:hypothetical protein CLOM_g10357 [Closterium sp. NIES-68]GJP75802.1 hypothetical protein CLOP_g6202 [Closterium sp. NIES-67]
MKSIAATCALIALIVLLPHADPIAPRTSLTAEGRATAPLDQVSISSDAAISAAGHVERALGAQAGRREELQVAAKRKVKCSKPGTGVCAMSGYPGCQKPRVYCGGACCIDTHEYSCCGGIMCCKVGACFRNVTTRTWGCCPIGSKACGGPKPGSRCCKL